MRELKFRVWDKSVEHLYEVQTLIDGGGVIGRYVLNGEMNYIQLCADDVIIEQYTGLKDKNGKEIYEGDIVERKKLILAREMAIPGWGKDHTDVRRATIVFENGSFYGRSVEAGLNFEYSWDELEEFFEIIGNIHENPELLEEEKCES